MRVLFLLATSATLIGVGDVTDMPFANYAIQGGAFAVLVWVLWYLLTKTLPGQRKEFTAVLDALAKRQDKWEADRRADSVKLNETLCDMTRHCAGRDAATKGD